MTHPRNRSFAWSAALILGGSLALTGCGVPKLDVSSAVRVDAPATQTAEAAPAKPAAETGASGGSSGRVCVSTPEDRAAQAGLEREPAVIAAAAEAIEAYYAADEAAYAGDTRPLSRAMPPASLELAIDQVTSMTAMGWERSGRYRVDVFEIAEALDSCGRLDVWVDYCADASGVDFTDPDGKPRAIPLLEPRSMNLTSDPDDPSRLLTKVIIPAEDHTC